MDLIVSSGDKLEVSVKPKSSFSKIEEKEGDIIVFLKSPPENNKANKELVTLFKKNLGLEVEIIKGLKSKKKLLYIK